MPVRFTCTQCKQLVDDASVMINDDYFHAGIQWARVVCKPCTRALDGDTNGQRMHNMWEVGWIAESPISVMASVIHDLSEGRQKWSKQALDDVCKIVSEAHPELSNEYV